MSENEKPKKYSRQEYNHTPMYQLWTDIDELLDVLLVRECRGSPKYFTFEWNQERLFYILRIKEELQHLLGIIWYERPARITRADRLQRALDYYKKHSLFKPEETNEKTSHHDDDDDQPADDDGLRSGDRGEDQ